MNIQSSVKHKIGEYHNYTIEITANIRQSSDDRTGR